MEDKERKATGNATPSESNRTSPMDGLTRARPGKLPLDSTPRTGCSIALRNAPREIHATCGRNQSRGGRVSNPKSTIIGAN